MTMPTELCRMKVSALQQRLARKAVKDTAHRFTNLYDLLTWEPLMTWAFETLMTHRGSRTPGVDGITKETARDHAATILADVRAALKTGSYVPRPVRRVYIAKANGKRRPLGIATLTDRLVQLMVKAILEPIFESDFLPTSHGFRPGRSCHTALAHLHLRTAPRRNKMYWTIEGDIVGCFDAIRHKTLLRLLKRRIQDKKLLRLIGQTLKAGVLVGGTFTKTAEGSPQGSPLSPLLANVYLHELDRWFHERYLNLSSQDKARRRAKHLGNAFYLRYADDFVAAWNGPKAGAQQLKDELGDFLRDTLGLELSAEKTRITHITDGYDFLGFTVRRITNMQRGTDTLLVYPSKPSVMKLKRTIKAMTTRTMTYAAVKDKLTALNALLRGWANYYRHSAASTTLSYVGHYAFMRMERWLRSKTGLPRREVYKRYYRRHGSYLTWADGEVALFHPGIATKIRYLRYTHRPNPYLDTTIAVAPPAQLEPQPEQVWSGAVYYGADWTDIRAGVLKRDRHRCVLCQRRARLEVHHLRKHKPGQVHDPAKLITLCAPCHDKVRNPQSVESRQLARYHLETGEP